MKQSKPNKTHTPSSAAEHFGVTPQYIRTLVVLHGLGEQITGGRYLLYGDDMERLERILSDAPPRRPRISART